MEARPHQLKQPARNSHNFTGRSHATFSAVTCILTLHSTPELILPLPSISSLFSLPPRSAAPYECIYAVTAGPTPSICHIHAVSGEAPSLSLISQTALPLPSPAAFILPVDPMGWISSRGQAEMEKDVLLSVGRDGDLMFWIPEVKRASWRCTGRVRTGRTSIRMARCSSAKKTVLSAFSRTISCENIYAPVQSFHVQMGRNSRSGTRRSLSSHRDWSM